MTLSVPIVFLPGAGRTLCSILSELYYMGVAVLLDARTILIATCALSGHAGWCEDTFDDSVHASENSVVARLQPVLGVSWTLPLLLHDVGEVIC